MKSKNLFVVILRYLVAPETIEPYRADHVIFLQKYYASGHFIVSGIQNPGNGGVIFAKSENRKALEDLLKEDPFATHHLAEYQIFEFNPTRHSEAFKAILS
ncbi:MAG: GTP cyclohydrolase [bacterium]|nr:GTP cyclohydrolase [bacterium]